LLALAGRGFRCRLIFLVAALLAGLVRAGLVALLFEILVAEAFLRFDAVLVLGAGAGAVLDAVAGLGAIAVLAGSFDFVEDLFLLAGGGDGRAVLFDGVFNDEAVFTLGTLDLFPDQAGLYGDHS